jgi:acyl-[acyl-carrier-protein]-phospholipid O-acyltransferase / long-chain-fatty-acid--[acyl-carrier-protein] ligase
MAQMNIDQFAFEAGATREVTKTPLLMSLIVGIGVGSVLAGVWSQGSVELGILPLGAFGVAPVRCCCSPSGGRSSIHGRRAALLRTHGRLRPAADAGNQCRAVLGPAGSISAASQPPKLARLDPRRRQFPDLRRHPVFSLLFACSAFPFTRAPTSSLPISLEPRLPDLEAQRSRQVVARFQREWTARRVRWSGDRGNLAEDLPEEARSAALARLSSRMSGSGKLAKLNLPDFDYLNQYPDEAARIREVLLLANKRPLLSARGIFLVCGLLTVPVFLYIVCLIPQASIRFRRLAGQQHGLPNSTA